MRISNSRESAHYEGDHWDKVSDELFTALLHLNGTIG